jgi:hypothetical protein
MHALCMKQILKYLLYYFYKLLHTGYKTSRNIKLNTLFHYRKYNIINTIRKVYI